MQEGYRHHALPGSLKGTWLDTAALGGLRCELTGRFVCIHWCVVAVIKQEHPVPQGASAEQASSKAAPCSGLQCKNLLVTSVLDFRYCFVVFF